MDTTAIGDLRLSRLLLGSNPFSGFSHQGIERDERMVHHYSVARIKQALFEAERLGIHYKVLAAGRNDPEQAFAYCCARMRPQDLACIGIFTGDDARMLETDVRLFETHSRERQIARSDEPAPVLAGRERDAR